MNVLAAFLVGVLSTLLPALCLWSVWLSGIGFDNAVWLPVALFPVIGVIVMGGIAKGWRP